MGEWIVVIFVVERIMFALIKGSPVIQEIDSCS